MERQTTSYRHIIKYTSLFGTIQGLNIAVGMVRNKLVAVILGPDGMGLISLFNSTIKLVSDSTNMGVSTSGVKTISDEYETGDALHIADSIRLIRSWSLLVALLGMMVCALAAPWVDSVSFSWGEHTLHYLLLSPVVGLMAITGGEMAVLKAVRQLKALARISVYNTLAVLAVTIPLYYIYGVAAIVPSLFVAALIQCMLTARHSYRLYPLRISMRIGYLRHGNRMIRLGAAFVLAGMMGSGMEFAIRSYLNTAGSLETVGLYNAGYMITMTYGSMVFSAMDTDYFPRLAAVPGIGIEMNNCVNRQIEVSVLMMAPLLILFMTGLPILLPMLFSGKFMPVLGMVQVTILALFVRSVKLPLAYIPLGRNDSASYLLMEGAYVVMALPLMYVCYRQWGLTGTGIALLAAAIGDMLTLLCYTRWRYGYKPARHTMVCVAVQLPLLLGTYMATTIATSWTYWVIGVLIAALSAYCSHHILTHHNTPRSHGEA